MGADRVPAPRRSGVFSPCVPGVATTTLAPDEPRSTRETRMRKIAIAVLVALSAALVAVPAPAFAEPADVVATEVDFAGADGVVLHGTVLAPGPAGKTP